MFVLNFINDSHFEILFYCLSNMVYCDKLSTYIPAKEKWKYFIHVKN